MPKTNVDNDAWDDAIKELAQDIESEIIRTFAPRNKVGLDRGKSFLSKLHSECKA